MQLSGGTSTVHAAEVGGRACVMKVANGSAAAAACLTREAAALSRLGTPLSPALLSQLTTADGRPALVIERIDGEPLSQWRRGASLEARLAVASRLVEQLAQIHARGVVHGDLSGTNVLVTGAGGVRIIDFGAARVDGGGAGPRLATPAYLAPVQGAAVASRADDVYAAGVLLFELGTQRLPFEGGAGVLRQAHAVRRPPLPSSLAPLPRAVDRVIGRCLAKDAARRFTDGAALREAWVSAVSADAPRSPRLGRGTDPAVAVAVGGPQVHAALVGFRHRGDVAAARRIVERGGGTLAHVAGDVGVAAWTYGIAPDRAAAAAQGELAALGCVDLIADRAAVRIDDRGVVRGAAVVRLAARVAAAPPIAVAAATAPSTTPMLGRDRELARIDAACRAAMTRRCPVLVTIEGEPGSGKSRLLDEVAGQLGDALGAGVPGAVVRIGGVVSDRRAGGAELERQVGAPAEVERTRGAAVASLARRLIARATGAGLVLVVDDVQWIEELVLDAATLAVRIAGEVALAVIVAGRPGSFAAPGLRQAGSGRVALELAPLDAATAAQLCRALLSDVIAVPAAAIDRLAAHAGGVPLVVHELVRALRDAGGVRHGRLDAGVVRIEGDAAVIEWAVDRELARLDPELRAHAYLAAVLGTHADASSTARVLDRLDEMGEGAAAPLDAGAALERLVAAGFLRQREGAVELRHGLVRDAVVRRVPAAQHRAIAAAACDALRGLAGATVRATWAEVAGRSDDAIAAWREVGADAFAGHDYLTVEHACGRALALTGAHDPRRAELLGRRATARSRLGRHVAGAADFAAARACGAGADRQAELLLDEAMALDWARDFEGARARTDEAAALVTESSPPVRLAALALAVGRARWRAGDPAAARLSLERALALAAALDDASYELGVVAGIVLGWVLAELGELDRAQALLAAAGAAASAHGDRLHEAAALNNQAFVSWRRGAVAELPALHARVVALGRELGMPTHEYRATSWMFEVTLDSGRLDDARDHAERLVVLEADFPELFPAPDGRGALARVAAARAAMA